MPPAINMTNKEPVRMIAETNVSNREKEILKLVSQGQSNKMIADVLCISIRTVETHRLNLLRKLDVNNAAEMVKKGLEIGLI